MTPQQFIAKWRSVELKVRSAAPSHFLDLCELLGEPKPTDADPRGEWYCFERGATKTTGGEGWADVWKRGCFGWEYKGQRKSLDDALDQLKRYALALENPPLLVVSDLDRFRIVTNGTNPVSYRDEIAFFLGQGVGRGQRRSVNANAYIPRAGQWAGAPELMLLNFGAHRPEFAVRGHIWRFATTGEH